MGSYSGPATILVDGVGLIDEVEASLVVPERPVGDDGWFGTLRGDFDAFDLMDGDLSLRLPDGRASRFRLSRSDLVAPRQGVDIVGIDVPPF